MSINYASTNYRKIILSKLVTACGIKRSAKNFYHILRPWSSANGPAAKDACQQRSLIDRPINEPLRFKNVVLFNKRTRYEFEKMLSNRTSEKDFENYVNFLGSDYKKLLEHHNMHHKELDRLVGFFQKRGVNVQVTNRSDFDHEKLKHVDAVLTAGGDGTFLQAAGWVKDNSIPVIGFNTDPTRSQGHLCLPNMDIEEVYDRLQSGHFRWLNRQRIEVSLAACETVTVTDLHVHGRPSFEYPVSTLPPDPELPGFVILPSLALNEVFIGENSNALASYYEVTIDEQPSFKQKSSGLTVSTGTGSTSWYHTITTLHPDTVKSLLQLANDIAADSRQGGQLPVSDQKFVNRVVESYNSALIFHPEDKRMAYASRDPITNEVFKLTAPRGYCQKLRIRSRMQDGGLVIDGGIQYTFSMGAETVVRIAPQSQALRTVSFFQSRKKNHPQQQPANK